MSIQQAAKYTGVSRDTLRRWEREGILQPKRTAGGHRRYDAGELQGITNRRSEKPIERITLGYARVSSYDQKDDLVRQIATLSAFCAKNGWSHEIIEDLGSGLNYNKKGLRSLLQRICEGEIDRLVVTHKDRLLRFGSEIVFSLCEHFGVAVVIINQGEDRTYESDLVQDVLEIITVFSARLYGSRSHKNKEVANEVRKKDTARSQRGNKASTRRAIQDLQLALQSPP